MLNKMGFTYFQLPTSPRELELLLLDRIRPQMKHLHAPGVLWRIRRHEAEPGFKGFVSGQVDGGRRQQLDRR